MLDTIVKFCFKKIKIVLQSRQLLHIQLGYCVVCINFVVIINGQAEAKCLLNAMCIKKI